MADTLRVKRGQVKGKLTRFQSYFDSINSDSVNDNVISQLQLRLGKIECCWDEFNDSQAELEIVAPSESDAKSGNNLSRRFLRIFWRPNPDEKLKCFELNTVRYGTASALYLVVKCLRQIAKEIRNSYPFISKIIANDFYVDDLLTGTDSLKELVEVQRQVTEILASYGFELIKWFCNDTNIVNEFVVNKDLEANIIHIVLTEIESILNSRSLCTFSNDPNDLVAITPGHFIIGKTLTALPEPSYTAIPENRLTSYQRLQAVRQHFWVRWSKEYLTGLQTRVKWKKNSNYLLQKGSLVLLKNGNQPPQNW
ncbi:hypothetical protein Trydic_g16413 [Trypoxylus dichotomus]